MKLVIIYGPPAVGKLTVARELADTTNLKVFHNHMTNDLLMRFMEFGTDVFFKYNNKIRELVIEAAAKSNTSLIFTFCYAYKEDDGNIKKLLKLAEKNDIDVSFVQLICEPELLCKRVKNESRKEYKKLQDVCSLNQTMDRWQLFKPIPFVDTFIINNSEIKAKKVAKMIKEHYEL